jgi:hypothetical protein
MSRQARSKGCPAKTPTTLGHDGLNRRRALAAKIARAMLSGPREITKNATVAEMGADGNLIVLRQGTNDWVCFPGDENEIGNSYVRRCDGLAMDDGRQGQEAQAHEYGPRSYLYAVWCYAAQQYRPVRSNQSSYPDWSPLDDYLALRCQTLWVAQYREGRGRVGDVRWHPLRLSAHLRHAVGRKRIRIRSDPDLDDAIWQAIGDLMHNSGRDAGNPNDFTALQPASV